LTGRVEGRGGYVSQSKVKAETNNTLLWVFIRSIQKTLYFVGAYYMLVFLGVSQLQLLVILFPLPTRVLPNQLSPMIPRNRFVEFSIWATVSARDLPYYLSAILKHFTFLSSFISYPFLYLPSVSTFLALKTPLENFMLTIRFFYKLCERSQIGWIPLHWSIIDQEWSTRFPFWNISFVLEILMLL